MEEAILFAFILLMKTKYVDKQIISLRSLSIDENLPVVNKWSSQDRISSYIRNHRQSTTTVSDEEGGEKKWA